MNKKQLAMDFANSLDHFEIEKIILFGSVARGDDIEEFDIDILILTTDEDKISDTVFNKVNEIFLDTFEYLSVKIIPVEYDEEYKSTSFYSTVNKKGVVIG